LFDDATAASRSTDADGMASKHEFDDATAASRSTDADGMASKHE
jgi:hypothetical protein